MMPEPAIWLAGHRPLGPHTGAPGLSETASIEFSRLKTFSARTIEILSAGNLQMTAVVANKPPVWKGCHRSKFVVLVTIRAPQYRHGHCQHSPGKPAASGVFVAGF